MGAQVEVLNCTNVLQVHGTHDLKPGEWTPVPYELAARLAKMPEYRVDDAALLGDYKFLTDGGRHIGWSSPFHYCDGYGSIAQDITYTFLQMGVNLSIHPRDYTPEHERFGGLPLDRWEREAFVPRSIVEALRHEQEDVFYGFNMTWPLDIYKHPFVRGIGFTMFETTAPPRAWADTMNKCRRIVVPCKQNKEAFGNIGVTAPIHVVPLGVDPERWTYVDRDPDNPFGFTFLMAGGITHRKNPRAAARAFVDAFPRERDVRLVIKTRGSQTALGFREWCAGLPDDARIEVKCEESKPSEMVAYMQMADCFVFPSRGEGFGLPPMQAMATGCPTILSDNSGMSEYANPRYCWPISCQEVKVPHQSQGGFPEEWGDVGNWWEPSHEALVEAMREVYRNREKAYAKGRKAAKWIRERWTVELTCRDLLDVVMFDAKESGIV